METKKRTASLVTRLTWKLRLRALSQLLFSCLGLLFAGAVGWCFAVESEALGSFDPFISRSFFFQSASASLSSLSYELPYETIDVFVIGEFLSPWFIVVGCIFCAGFSGWLLGFFKEQKNLKALFAPIDEMAAAAQQLAEHSFDEEKLRNLESAIAGISAPDARIEVEDEELMGLEQAMNDMLRRLQESARQQMRFVDDASHELRTPIAVLQGYTRMLERWGKSDPKVLEESIAAIATETEHMKTLVEQLLFLARGDMGRSNLTLKPMPLSPLMKELFEESRMIDGDHEYTLEVCPELWAQGDEAMLKQALRILIDNAAKYTPEGGQILLRMSREGENVLLAVQDSGIGIAAEDVAHVFDRFYRADKARTKGGSGLGLSIAKWIIEGHGGTGSVLSYEGVGTRVTVSLPLLK